ncbi:helix-turn-helix domain-containing protein [Streptomyces sp. NPDC090022]|uniref:helix-turn-helix domain-containing protein n=1 Tax=Streptomyces sp. NPDC090022 TaxID=3365920 RepID=UPI0037F24E1D
MTYRLRIDQLRDAARKAGDQRAVDIAKRTGISESAVSRMLRGRSTPGLGTIMKLRDTYGLTNTDLIEEVAA